MNNLQTKTDAQLRAEKAAILRELSRRRKAGKPKLRKQRTVEERERARAYVAFLRDRCEQCWICGRTANDRPAWWHGVFMVERMHLTHDGTGKRCEDVRLLVAGCSLCHRIEHGDRFVQTLQDGNLQEAVGITRLLEIKREHDPDNYDPEFLQSHSIRRLEFPK